MDFNDTPKEAEFREKVRTFLDQNVEKRSTNLKTVQGGSAGAPESVKGGEGAAEEALNKAKEFQRKNLKQALQLFYGLQNLVVMEEVLLNKLFINKRNITI